MKDVEANPDFTSQQLLAEKQKRLEEEEAEQSTTSKKGKEDLQQKEQFVKTVKKQWHEAKSDEGYTYYWNIVSAGEV